MKSWGTDKEEEPDRSNFHELVKVFHAVKYLNDFISEQNPSVERNLKITCG